ncbi:hypothetical protein Hdeb2414_s0037g00732521 [Helianthus debilis subsp. tardiflorus]
MANNNPPRRIIKMPTIVGKQLRIERKTGTHLKRRRSSWKRNMQVQGNCPERSPEP